MVPSRTKAVIRGDTDCVSLKFNRCQSPRSFNICKNLYTVMAKKIASRFQMINVLRVRTIEMRTCNQKIRNPVAMNRQLHDVGRTINSYVPCTEGHLINFWPNGNTPRKWKAKWSGCSAFGNNYGSPHCNSELGHKFTCKYSLFVILINTQTKVALHTRRIMSAMRIFLFR